MLVIPNQNLMESFMERYYKLLGITSSASKDEIKRTYHAKLMALHPDKVHGTVLEDTANFMTAEINEAYNYLMSNFKKNQSSAYKAKKPKYAEENVYIKNNGLLNYTLSDDFEEIKKAMLRRTGKNELNLLNELIWYINPNLSNNVKQCMNRHNFNYSMTMYYENKNLVAVVNKRIGYG